MAIGVMDALKAKGLQIPGEISVIGFDDSPASDDVYPRLTTVRQPLSDIGEQAVRLMLQRIRGQGGTDGETERPIHQDQLVDQFHPHAPLPEHAEEGVANVLVVAAVAMGDAKQSSLWR